MATGKQARTRQVTNGALFPSLDDLKSITTKLRTEIGKNKKLAATFKKDPRAVLAAAGLNEDIQNELLGEAGLATSAAIACWFSCWHTCWFTGCACTNAGTIIIKTTA